MCFAGGWLLFYIPVEYAIDEVSGALLAQSLGTSRQLDRSLGAGLLLGGCAGQTRHQHIFKSYRYDRSFINDRWKISVLILKTDRQGRWFFDDRYMVGGVTNGVRLIVRSVC